MAEIYSSAKLVLIWTGCVFTWSDAALHLCNRLNIRLKLRLDNLGLAKLFRCKDHALVASSYWTRMSIVQEVELAQRATIFTWRFNLTLSTILQFCQKAKWDINFRTAMNIAEHANSDSGELSGADRDPYSWQQSLQALGQQRCSERKDNIYSLLGITGNHQAPDDIKIPVNYEEDIITVFMRTVEQLMYEKTHRGAPFYNVLMVLADFIVATAPLHLTPHTFCIHFLAECGESLGSAAEPIRDVFLLGGEQSHCRFLFIIIDQDTWIPTKTSVSHFNVCNECLTVRGNVGTFTLRQHYCHLWMDIQTLPDGGDEQAPDWRIDRARRFQALCSEPQDRNFVLDQTAYNQLFMAAGKGSLEETSSWC